MNTSITSTSCIQAKTQAKSHPPRRYRVHKKLHTVHADLVGPLSGSLLGHHYWLTLVDNHTRHGWSLPLKYKHQAKTEIIGWIAEQERQQQCPVNIFHCDRGGEFLNEQLTDWFKAKGIRIYLSNPESPEQSGIAEARNKTVTRILRNLLIDSGASPGFLSLGLPHANHLANLLPHMLLHGSTPAEQWTSEKPALAKLKVWGCVGHVLATPKDIRHAGGSFLPGPTSTSVHTLA